MTQAPLPVSISSCIYIIYLQARSGREHVGILAYNTRCEYIPDTYEIQSTGFVSPKTEYPNKMINMV